MEAKSVEFKPYYFLVCADKAVITMKTRLVQMKTYNSDRIISGWHLEEPQVHDLEKFFVMSRGFPFILGYKSQRHFLWP